MKLYEISTGIKSILETEEWTDETESALDELNIALETKTQNILQFRAEVLAYAIAAKAEADRLYGIAKAATARAERLLSYVERCMVAAERDEVKTATHTVKFQSSPPALKCDDETATPAQFVTIIPQQVVPNKDAIKQALKDGGDVPGWHLEQGRHLRVR